MEWSGEAARNDAHQSSSSWLQLLRITQPAATLVALLCIALVSSTQSHPQSSNNATPLRRRTRFIASVLLALLATYFFAGALLVLRAVVPAKHRLWTPELPSWTAVDWQILLELVALGSTLTFIAWQQRQNGVGRYSVVPLFSAAVFGGITDVAIFVLYALHNWRRGHSVTPDERSPWTIAQIAIQASRILIFWPLLLVLANASRLEDPEDTTEPADARLANNTASAASTQHQPSEQTALLAATNATPGPSSYGAATSTNGTPNNAKSSSPSTTPRPNSSAASANASMGLTLASAPPPPTFRVFFQRILLLFPYLWPSKSLPLQALAILCVFLLVLGRLVNLAVPLILGRIVDRLAADGKTTDAGALSVWWLIGGYALLKCLQGSGGLLVVLQNFAWLPLQQYSDRQMSLMAFRHLLDLSMSFHTKRKTGEVLRILDRGSSINNFFQYLIFSVAPIFFDIFIATGFLSLTFGPQVGLLLFAIMFVYTAISIKMTTWRTSLRRDANNKDSVSRAIHTDVLLNWETVKSYNNEGYESERYRLSLLDYQRAEWKVSASLNVLNLVQNLTLSVGTLLMLFVVAYDVVNGYATSSDFVVFISYLAQIYGPLNMLSTLYRVIQTSLVDTDKLIALLGEEKDIKDVPDAQDLQVREGVVEFRNVKFSYDGKVEALKGLNFTIKPKSKVALVGESGAGKSSVLRLLYRFYDPSSGQILIDGQDIRKVTQHSLRKAIGVVPQEAGLLNTSIRTNIGYGRTDPPASDEEIDAAAAAAQILDKIRTFPEGMNTVVGERGVRLSGGEKQRVAIARTFLKAPPILLLDEATSALDSQTERQLQTALQTLMQGKTSLTIAHRLSTIVNSDQIVVLHDGSVVESGTHEELLNVEGGRYRAMWKSQVETDKEREREREQQQHKEEEQGEEVQVQGDQEATGTRTAPAPTTSTEATTASSQQYEIAPEVLAPLAEASKETSQQSTPEASGVVVIDGDGQHEGDVGAAVTAAAAEPTASGTASTDETTHTKTHLDSSVDSAGAGAGVSSHTSSSPRLSRHSTQSVRTTNTNHNHQADQQHSAPGTPSVGSSSGTGTGNGRMRQRFASFIRRSTSGSGSQEALGLGLDPSGSGSGTGSGAGTAGAPPPPPASPTTMRTTNVPSPQASTSTSFLKRSLSTRSNQSGNGNNDKAGGTGTSSPRLAGSKPLPEAAIHTADSPSSSSNATPAATAKPISTSGVSAGGKKKKNGKKGGGGGAGKRK